MRRDRRCGWCARPLRWWQVTYCRRCNRALSLEGVGSPYPSGSRRRRRADSLFRIGDSRG